MVSYFQAYFQASSMPKRLLQYALSRLEILDIDALDLKNLDIAWGKNSTFEFRDVGLRLKKLEGLLQLPPSFKLVKAQVLLLRLTVPVNINSSPIQVEVDGVDCRLRIQGQSEKGQGLATHERKRRRSSHARGEGSTERGGQDAHRDDGPSIPTAVDVAQSFLHTEPSREKEELEAAILLETQDLAASTVSSDEGDMELPVGTGAALSLPAFMATFLQGIVDRLQVKVHGIVISADVDLPADTSRSPPHTSSDTVTIQLKVDDVDIEGVTHETSPGGAGQNLLLHKDGKRLTCLHSICGALICDANLSASLARSSALSSPEATHSNILDGRRNPSKSHSSTSVSGLGAFDGTDSSEHLSTAPSRRPSTRSSRRRNEDLGLSRASATASDSGRFDDAPEDEGHGNLETSVRSDADGALGDSLLKDSAILEQVTESQYLEEDELGYPGPSSSAFAGTRYFSPTLESPFPTPQALKYTPFSLERDLEDLDRPASDRPGPNLLAQSSALLSSQRLKPSLGRFSQAHPIHPSENISQDQAFEHEVTQPASLKEEPSDTSQSGDDDGGSTPMGEEDLAQSQLFSHEDAESMYMSALSHSSRLGKVPGAWNHSSNGSDEVSSTPGTPTGMKTHVDQLDNLEHARQSHPVHSLSQSRNYDNSPEVPENMPSSPRATLHQVKSNQPLPSIPQSSSRLSEPSSTTSSEGDSRVAKHLFVIDQINMYLPGGSSTMSEAQEGPASTMRSTSNDSHINTSHSTSINVPGAFSAHLPARQAAFSTPAAETRTDPKPPDPKSVDQSFEVAIGDLSIDFDIAMAKLIFKLVKLFKEEFEQRRPSSGNSNSGSNPSANAFHLSAQQVTGKLVEKLRGISAAGTSNPEGRSQVRDVDILLQTSLKGLKLSLVPSESLTSITLNKFKFGYLHENIVSFDAGLQMRASVRDLKASAGIDMSMNIIQVAGTTRYNITTLPLHVSLDLLKLDETLSWFGGLSSVLSVGSSMASHATVTTTSPGKPKARGVHFAALIKPEDASLTTQNKADIRFGGLVLDLVGSECSIGVTTSAVKVVSRDEGLGIGINKIRLSGPYLKHSDDDPAIGVELNSLRVEYLSSPTDVDLDRLLSLITPSKSKYDQDDDILLDTLLRQRKQGPVLRLTVDDFQTRAAKLDELSYLPELVEEASRLSTVAKYLPEDDRPGLLSLVEVRNFSAHLEIHRDIGNIHFVAKDVDVAQITLPALVALSIGTVAARRNGSEVLLDAATAMETQEPRSRAPAIMARIIGDEMEPVVKIKLWNIKLEYQVPTLVAILGLRETATANDISAGLTASVTTLTDLARSKVQKEFREPERPGSSPTKPMMVGVVLRDCVLGLNPQNLPSKVLIVLTQTHVSAVLPKDQNANITADMSKASLLVIDDVANIGSEGTTTRARQSFDGGSSQVADLCATGFVSVSYISSAKAVVRLMESEDGEHSIDVELRDDLFVLETCADSTQTLVAALSGLVPPTPPTKDTKYRTKVIPVKDLLASLSGDAFGTAEGEYDFDEDFGTVQASSGSGDPEGEGPDDLDFDSHYYQGDAGEPYEELFQADEEDEIGSDASPPLTIRDTNDGILLESFAEQPEVDPNEELDFQEEYFGAGSVLEGTAHRWNSAKNTYDRSNVAKVRHSPLKVCVRDVHIIWNLFDGYDWQNTRDTIAKAVQEVESKAIEKRTCNERRPTFNQDVEEDETVIGDFLFNSIYIGIPANRDPRELAAAINQELNDNATETESIATTSISSSSRPGGSGRTKLKKLRLDRSKHHKITFELRGVCVDLVTFPPDSGETQSSIDLRVHDFEIFDHVPTSKWRKFATYMQDVGERETGSNMIHIEILNVKPVPELAASEIVLKATVLPLRLHVDQDALDFITRFFEFKTDSVASQPSPADVPFLQRVEVNSVHVKLDFKPKRVDYAGIRSGHTTEFMNFVILDEAEMVLRHTIIYGISGFDKLGKCLNDIWMLDIKRNQLPGILAGLAPVRSLVNVGGGFRHLVLVPMREYKKDGRILRGISKGAAAFAKTTGTELVKLGAKVAIGVQTVLQGAEGFLSQPVETPKVTEVDDDEEETKHISPYANQPVGVFQGLRGGYSGLQRDLVLARDAIIAVPGEVMEEGTATGVLRAVRKHAPTVILRPAIGVAKAGGQILMGATNSLDPANLRKVDAKYKKH